MGHDTGPDSTRNLIAYYGRCENGIHGHLRFLDSRQGLVDRCDRFQDHGRSFFRFRGAGQGFHIVHCHADGGAGGVQQSNHGDKKRSLFGLGAERREQFRSDDSGRVLLDHGGRQELFGKRGKVGGNVYRLGSERARSRRQRIERAVGGEQFEPRLGNEGAADAAAFLGANRDILQIGVG